MNLWLKRAKAAEHCAATLTRLADEYRAEGNRPEADRLRSNAQWWAEKAEGYYAKTEQDISEAA